MSRIPNSDRYYNDREKAPAQADATQDASAPESLKALVSFLGDAVSGLASLLVRAAYIMASATLEAGAAEQTVDLTDENGDSITETVDGDPGWIDVREYTRLTVRGEASSGGGTTDTDAKLYGRVAATSDDQTIKGPITFSAGTPADLVRSLEVADLSYVKLTETSASDTADVHSFYTVIK